MDKKKNRYLQIIESIITRHFKCWVAAIAFERDDIVTAAQRLKVALLKKLNDVLYSFRYRVELPHGIARHTMQGYEWIIRPVGRASKISALFAFECVDGAVKVIDEKHYRLVRPDELSSQELLSYQNR